MGKQRVSFAKLLSGLRGIPKFRETRFKKLRFKLTNKLEGNDP